MFCLKGYNQMLKKWIEMKILDDGTVLADDWEHIEEGSIKRYTEQMDASYVFALTAVVLHC